MEMKAFGTVRVRVCVSNMCSLLLIIILRMLANRIGGTHADGFSAVVAENSRSTLGCVHITLSSCTMVFVLQFNSTRHL